MLAILPVLASCATAGVQCDMRTEYERPSAASTKGAAHLTWSFDAAIEPGKYGDTLCVETRLGRQCDVRLAGPPPAFDDVCGLARLGHEVGHVMRGDHE